MAEEQVILPEGYKRVEYIQSTGTQYINTGIVPDSNTGTYVKAICTGGGGSDNIDGASNRLMTPHIRSGNSAGYAYNGSWSGLDGSWIASEMFEGKLNFLNDGLYSLKQNNVENGGNLPSVSFTNTYELYLCKPNGYLNYTGNWKIYSYRVSQGSDIIMDLIPCLDQNDNPCMYDLVSQKPFYNSGTGNFLFPYSVENLKPVPYLISNGNQFINTGYIPNKNTGFWIEAQALYGGDMLVMGSGPNNNSNSMTAIRVPGTNGNSTGGYWNGWLSFNTLGSGRRYISETNFLNNLKANIYIDDDLVASKQLTEFKATSSYPVFLFGSNDNGNNNSPWIGKIYRAKISEGNKIIHDYVPMVDPLGNGLMFDIIEQKSYYPNNNLIIPKNIEFPYFDNDFNLPAGYTKCLYLQSDDKQYIDTGIVPNDETGLSIKAELTSLGSTGSTYFGVVEDVAGCRFATPFFTDNVRGVMAYEWHQSYTNILYNRTPDREFYSSINLYNNRYVYYSSKHINYLNTLTKTLGNFVQPIWLFTYNSRGSYNDGYGNWQGKVFRAQITQGDTLVRDFVPCLDENNKPCMYDLISETPFYNQGTGADFTYCVDHSLPSNFIKLKYLESFGKQYIKTGHIPTENTGLYVEAYHTGKILDKGGLCLALRQSSNTNTYFAAPRVTTFWSVCYGWNNVPDLGGTFNTKYEGWMNWLNSKKVLVTSPHFADKTSNITTSLSFTPTEDLYMFNTNPVYDKSVIADSSWRIYRAKISEGEEIMRDFVPAFDERLMKPCMYDLVNNVAYYNDGEGEFDYNRDFEGTYTGYGVSSVVGNRLGYLYGEI